MQRSTLWLLALAPAAIATATTAPRGPTVVPGIAPRALAEDTDYAALVAEYVDAKKTYDAAAKEAREKKEKPPAKIVPAFFPRFEAFAAKGHLAANLWCADNLGRANLTNAQLKGKALGYCNTLVAGLLSEEKKAGEKAGGEKAEEPVIRLADLVAGTVPRLLAQKFLTLEEAQGLCVSVRDGSKDDESKAAAHLQAALLPFGNLEDKAERETKSLEVHREVAAKYPKTQAGAESRGEVNRVENLVEGKVAPDFTTDDVEGVAFKLSDYRGKVVLLDFWGFW